MTVLQVCHRFDAWVIGRIGAARRSWLTRMLVPYTIAGTIGLPWLLAGAAVDQAQRVAIAAGLAALVANAVKYAARRTRPDHLPLLVRPLRSSSFPSGHAASATAAMCALLVVAPGLAPLWISMALAMAVSRIYVGVHYPTDVLAGAGLGLLVAAVPLLIAAT
ncbi:MAG TPA: phosphatase PAP2 family protein [Gaiellales bacterium]|nr:phosphatase PAP2 family protein [Gaiellales bacterium]